MWAFASVFYHIYPLGLCGAPRENDGVQAHRIPRLKVWAGHIPPLGAQGVYPGPAFESGGPG